MDILDIPFIQRIEEAQNYHSVIRTLWIDAAGWTKEIRTRYPEVVQIGLSDHPLSTHISRLPADKQLDYIQDLQYLDGVMALTEEEKSWYKNAVPSIPVIKGGLPFPVEKYEEKYGHLRNSKREFIALGVGAADSDRNFISNLLVFRELRRRNPNLVGVFLSIPHQLMPYCTYMADNFDGVYIHQRESMDSFIEMLSRCKLVISLADRNTPGRIQGEAAFLKIPVIGSNRLELQEELYPDLAFKPFDIEGAVNSAQTILDNPDTAEFLSEFAYDKLVKNYDYEPSRKKFEDLVKQIRGE
jgi:glycosyltransferase involved in cell wall biosynthesis